MQIQPSTQNKVHAESTSSVNNSPRSKRTRRLRTIAGGVVAAGVLAVTLAAVPGPDTPAESVRTPVDQSAVAAWASANGMRGGSPASLSAAPETPVYAGVDQSAVAAWAIANGMRGGSPTSLGSPTGHSQADE